jgi:hypothetical protein
MHRKRTTAASSIKRIDLLDPGFLTSRTMWDYSILVSQEGSEVARLLLVILREGLHFKNKK